MINKTDLFRKVGGILAELNDQYQFIAENPDSFNELELELFSANADFLAEHTKILMKLTAVKPAQPVPAVKNQTTQPAVEKAVSHSHEESKSVFPEDKPAIGTVPSDIRNEIETPKTGDSSIYPKTENISTPLANNILPEELDLRTDNNQPEVKVPEVDPVPEFRQPEIVHVPEVKQPEIRIAEKEAEVKETAIPVKVVPERKEEPEPTPVQRPVLTLNDLMSEQKAAQSPSTPRFSSQAVNDLKSIINLNDKLLFIKELFNGYSLAYSEAIEILNRFDSFEAADHFLQANYATKNNWDSKQTTVDKFYELLHRRFS